MEEETKETPQTFKEENDKREEILKREEELISRKEELYAREQLSGKSDAGEVRETKEETVEEKAAEFFKGTALGDAIKNG